MTCACVCVCLVRVVATPGSIDSNFSGQSRTECVCSVTVHSLLIFLHINKECLQANKCENCRKRSLAKPYCLECWNSVQVGILDY